MRRGHPGIGNWRGENPRHFRPRGGGTPHLRPHMPFGSLDSPRFPPPVQRYRGPRPYNSHPIHTDDSGPSDHDRQYRGPVHQNHMRLQERHHDNRDRLPLIQMRKNNRGFFDGNNFNTNNMGDIDHRVHDVDHRQQTFGPCQMSPWSNPPFERRPFNNDKISKHHNMGDSLLPQPDYTGHRPPSSDHYSGDTGPNNNNNPYSRSVDDTVDIVRKRLLNRDSQDLSIPSTDQIDVDMRENTDKVYHDAPQEQPVKKRIQRQIRSNCDKMKNKIVHQLFKMDKGKIHKLMDNPNSSSKFEYAISSLITESQNSFNRHMRSVAEKSLSTTSSSTDFIHDDNNTIYEDTFMRQMQGVLDPQDTILLEDIKPLVLAELSKVLCMDDFNRCEGIDEHSRHPREEYYNEPAAEYNRNTFYDFDSESTHNTETITGDLYDDNKYDFTQQPTFEEPTPIFERRPHKPDFHDDGTQSRSTESWQNRSVENNSVHNRSNEEKTLEYEEPRPLFDGNCDQLSEDDDPFADLDNQYHVAVDHNFIGQEDGEIVSPILDQIDHMASKSSESKSDDIKISLPKQETPSNDIINEIDTHLQSIAKSPLKLLTTLAQKSDKLKTLKVKQEIAENVAVIKNNLDQKIVSENVKVKQEPQTKEDSELVKHAYDSGKHNSRKRSVDSKPSHRKEKRKKSSHSECHEAATSIFNMFYDKSEKDSNTVDSKGYSDKYVKRKETPKKSNKTSDTSKSGTQKKHNSNTNHSITSPKDTSSSCAGDQTSKSDKIKLTTIDIFSGGANAKPKKGNVHQAHRNSSITTPPTVPKSPDENKIKPIIPIVTSFARKLTKRHVGTQVIRKIRNKECQTLVLKKNAVGIQTDPVRFDKNQCLSEDPLERMKEIDMEIQMLLQEKFKLYNSMETRSKNTISSRSTMGTLGMAVLNVPIESEGSEREDSVDFLADSIAEDFTNLPVEDLEQIALETVEESKRSSPALRKLSRKQKIMEQTRKKSESPTTRKKNAKTPNISLLEQIISDDRPIEEIISLDDLETTPVRSKKKTSSRSSKSSNSSKSSKKKATRKHSKPFVLDHKELGIKDCSVVLEQLNIKAFLKAKANRLKIKISLNPLSVPVDSGETEAISTETALSPIPETISSDPERPNPPESAPNVVEEPANDIQIDMMEVCEDIVIGDEVKAVSDVEERVPITEEIILDNSQSSAEYSAPEITEGECKMYDYSTDDNLKRDSVTVTGNADAVLAVECTNNSFIAACLDGNVYHFSTDGQLLNTLRGSNLAVTCLTIVEEKYGTTVYTGSLDSRIRYYDLETGLEKGPECNVLSPIQTMDRAWDTVFVGTRTGFVLQFECKNNMLIPVSTVKFSEQSILALRAMKEGPRKVLLVAARSDNVTIKDAQTGLLLRTLEGPKMTVYSLLYEDGKVYCGTSSHQIHVFDYTSGSHVHAHSGGKGAVCLRATGGLVFAGCYDGCVYVYREGETRPLAQLRGPALMLLSLAIQGTKIIAGYKDRSLYIWKIPLAVLQEMIL